MANDEKLKNDESLTKNILIYFIEILYKQRAKSVRERILKEYTKHMMFLVQNKHSTSSYHFDSQITSLNYIHRRDK